jgi:hypothetical protein
MRTTRWAAIGTLMAISTAACGSGQGDTAGSSQAAKAERRADGSTVVATAEEVARKARGKVKCPARVKTADRPAAAPVDDILGVRPGLAFDEAVNLVLCSNEQLVLGPTTAGFDLRTFGQTIRQGFSASPAREELAYSSEAYMRKMSEEMALRSGNAVGRPALNPGESEWFVATMGMPGSEQVIAAAREEWFPEGRNPTPAAVRDALVEKYGRPTRAQEAGGRVYLAWVRDAAGRLLTEGTGGQARCRGLSSPKGGFDLSPECALIVEAVIHARRDNPALASSFDVGVLDQGRGWALLNSTQAGLQAMDRSRQEAEIQAAAGNAAKPRL